MDSPSVIAILVAALAACLVAAPLTECFVEAERAWVAPTRAPGLADRGGNAHLAPTSDGKFHGGWLPDAYTALPLNIWSVTRTPQA